MNSVCEMTEPVVHRPVMLGEVLDLLVPERGGVFVDATVGPGGHAEGIIERVCPGGIVICLDRDPEALSMARARVGSTGCVFLKSAFSEMRVTINSAGFEKVEGILMDLGVSMSQIKGEDRGFGFRSEGPLDMRMDTEGTLTAADIVNEYDERELEGIIREYGEEHGARRVARAIVRARREARISSCAQLADLVASVLGRHGRTHPATRTFQALRIAVNDEIGELREGLSQAIGLLAPGGRLVVISYHSLEDRVVKNFIRDSERGGVSRTLTKKPMVPSRGEVLSNPASRSAKLRAAEAL